MCCLELALKGVLLTSSFDHFTAVCSVTWPLNGSEAAGDLSFDTDVSAFIV